MAFTFRKEERLSHKSLIAKLFQKGNRSLSRFPFRFTWAEASHDGNYPIQVLLIVSKRNFPSAVSRNRIKRQMRELYRLNKGNLYEALAAKPEKFILSISYQAKTELSHAVLEPVFLQLFNQLKHEMANHPAASIHPPDKDL